MCLGDIVIAKLRIRCLDVVGADESRMSVIYTTASEALP